MLAFCFPFTYPSGVTVPLGLAVIMCEQAERAEATTMARLPQMRRKPLPTLHGNYATGSDFA